MRHNIANQLEPVTVQDSGFFLPIFKYPKFVKFQVCVAKYPKANATPSQNNGGK
jgi:hypothetical protein